MVQYDEMKSEAIMVAKRVGEMCCGGGESNSENVNLNETTAGPSSSSPVDPLSALKNELAKMTGEPLDSLNSPLDTTGNINLGAVTISVLNQTDNVKSGGSGTAAADSDGAGGNPSNLPAKTPDQDSILSIDIGNSNTKRGDTKPLDSQQTSLLEDHIKQLSQIHQNTIENTGERELALLKLQQHPVDSLLDNIKNLNAFAANKVKEDEEIRNRLEREIGERQQEMKDIVEAMERDARNKIYREESTPTGRGAGGMPTPGGESNRGGELSGRARGESGLNLGRAVSSPAGNQNRRGSPTLSPSGLRGSSGPRHRVTVESAKVSVQNAGVLPTVINHTNSHRNFHNTGGSAHGSNSTSALSLRGVSPAPNLGHIAVDTTRLRALSPAPLRKLHSTISFTASKSSQSLVNNFQNSSTTNFNNSLNKNNYNTGAVNNNFTNNNSLTFGSTNVPPIPAAKFNPLQATSPKPMTLTHTRAANGGQNNFMFYPNAASNCHSNLTTGHQCDIDSRMTEIQNTPRLSTGFDLSLDINPSPTIVNVPFPKSSKESLSQQEQVTTTNILSQNLANGSQPYQTLVQMQNWRELTNRNNNTSPGVPPPPLPDRYIPQNMSQSLLLPSNTGLNLQNINNGGSNSMNLVNSNLNNLQNRINQICNQNQMLTQQNQNQMHHTAPANILGAAIREVQQFQQFLNAEARDASGSSSGAPSVNVPNSAGISNNNSSSNSSSSNSNSTGTNLTRHHRQLQYPGLDSIGNNSLQYPGLDSVGNNSMSERQANSGPNALNTNSNSISNCGS